MDVAALGTLAEPMPGEAGEVVTLQRARVRDRSAGTPRSPSPAADQILAALPAELGQPSCHGWASVRQAGSSPASTPACGSTAATATSKPTSPSAGGYQLIHLVKARPDPAADGVPMKHAGILATTPEGAALCFRVFCQQGFTELGPHSHPDVTLDCTALARTLPAWQAADYISVRAALSVSVRRLAAAGADFFACPDNTAHLALEQPGPDLTLPGLHIADVVAEQAASDGRKRVGILGSRYTMDGPVYPQALAAHQIAAEIPSRPDRAILDQIIQSELVNGVFADTSRRQCMRIIERLAARGCDAVALACTEIPLLVPADTAWLPALDSTRLLALAALDVAAGRRPLPGWRGGPMR